LGAKTVSVKTDSKLVVEQVRGNFKVKDANLRLLWNEALKAAARFHVFSIEHVARSSCEGNKRADRLANIALDLAGK
jgi:ribonuclease HI